MIRTTRATSRRRQKKAMRSRCFVNDVEVSRCFFADDRRGIARAYVTDDTGHILFDRALLRPKTMELRGRVRLELS